MKTIQYLAGVISLLFISSFAQAQTAKSENIKVWGNCGMCKAHIEKAAKNAGATYAVWNKETKILSVKYEPSATSNKQIQEKVAAAGYDTKDLTGDQKAYDELDECCKYDRKASEKGKSKEQK
jgi:mercuric ion binding protein